VSPELLQEAAITPFRERDRSGRILPSPAFLDLPPESREALAAAQVSSRELESALNRFGWSGTVQAVMDRILGG
jgi:hypothetical protein